MRLMRLNKSDVILESTLLGRVRYSSYSSYRGEDMLRIDGMSAKSGNYVSSLCPKSFATKRYVADMEEAIYQERCRPFKEWMTRYCYGY